MPSTRRLTAMSALVTLQLGVQIPSAVAQNTALQLEEIIVTAQRREESIQDTPVSMVALDAETLAVRGIDNLDDMYLQVPNLAIRPFPTSQNTLRLQIRGLGTGDVSVTRDPGIGVYVNDIYIARGSGLALDVADIERIEVLRGPQGTLYGRNTIGGAVKVQSKMPDLDTVYFRQKVSAGNLDLLGSETIVNVPLTEKVGVKAVLKYRDREGFIENLGPGNDPYDVDSLSGRIDLRFEASEALRIDYSYDHSVMDNVNPVPTPVGPVAPFDPIFGTGGQIVATGGQVFTIAPGVLNGIRDNFIEQLPETRPESIRTFTPLWDSNTESAGHGLNIVWDLSDTITLKSSTSYRELEFDNYVDLSIGAYVAPIGSSSGERPFVIANAGIDLGPISTVPQGFEAFAGSDWNFPQTRTTLDHEQFSQEFQILGIIGERIEYLSGLYYFEETADDRRPPHSTSLFPFPGVGYLATVSREQRDVKNSAWAAFTEWKWTPGGMDERFNLALGVRYTEDKREATNNRYQFTTLLDLQPVSPVVSASASESQGGRRFSNVSYSLKLKYEFSENLRSYAAIQTGYKAGGYNTREPDPVFFAQGFDEETITNYELGLRSELFDRRMIFNATVFFSDYEDIQIGPPITAITGNVTDTRVFNAGTAEMSGVEIDAQALLTENVSLDFSYAYLDADYEEIDLPDNIFVRDFVLGAPSHSASMAVNYQQSLSVGRLLANINVGYNSEASSSTRADEQTATRIPEYALIGARLQLSEIKLGAGELALSLWGKNLADKDYIVDAGTALPGSNRAIYWGEPRTYGIDIQYSYR